MRIVGTGLNSFTPDPSQTPNDPYLPERELASAVICQALADYYHPERTEAAQNNIGAMWPREQILEIERGKARVFLLGKTEGARLWFELIDRPFFTQAELDRGEEAQRDE